MLKLVVHFGNCVDGAIQLELRPEKLSEFIPLLVRAQLLKVFKLAVRWPSISVNCKGLKMEAKVEIG